MLVEDNLATAQVIEHMLCRLQMLPVVASNASSALDILKAGRAFNWALVDAHLPNNDGWELAQQIRGQFAGQVRHLHQSAVGFGICEPGGGKHIATALDEALTNALFHGNLELDSALREDDDTRYHALARERLQQAPYRDRSIRVRARYSPSAFEVTITDEGPGFDPGSLPDPTDPENLCRPFGRGVMLMRSFMDDVCFNDRGNEVTLVKHRRDRESQR